MRKIKTLLSLLVGLTLMPQTGFASASGSARATQILNIATAGAAGAYSAANFSRCGPPGSFYYCIQGIMGTLQMLQSLMGAANSGDTGAALLNGDYGSFEGFPPIGDVLCPASSTTCTPDAIDNQLADFNTPFQTGEGYPEALEKLKQDALNRLKTAEKKGFKIDRKNGVIVGPDGKKTTFAEAASQVPKNLGQDAQQKFSGAVAKLSGGSSGADRGLASTEEGKVGAQSKTGKGFGADGASKAGGGSTSVASDSYGLGSGSSLGKKGGKGKKKSLFASLSDKDARKGAVGVAGDDIFGMINRRYIKKTKSSEFFKK